MKRTYAYSFLGAAALCFLQGHFLGFKMLYTFALVFGAIGVFSLISGFFSQATKNK